MTEILPLLLNARDFGGAGTATRRIHNGLQEIGVDSQMLVRMRSTDDPAIHGPTSKLGKVLARVRPFLDDLITVPYDPAQEYSVSWVPDRLHNRIEAFDPDVVHLNWIAGGYTSPTLISRIDRPIVWRFPDMWPMTGGCHYADDCQKFQKACGACPKLNSSHEWDPSRFTLERKRRAVADGAVHVVATTSWLADLAEKSSIFGDCPIEIIPNGLDTEIFQPIPSDIGRELFGLPKDALLILFGAVSPFSKPRKGFDLLSDGVSKLRDDDLAETELVVFGASEPDSDPPFDLPTHYTGFLNDEQSLAMLYSAVNAMIVPSRYEGFGQTVTEAMACGTPVVAFNATGPADTVIHKQTGYLADPYDPADLADGIRWVLADKERRNRIGENARQRAVENYNIQDVARQYQALYKRVCS